MSKGEEAFSLHLQAYQLSGWQREYRFHPERRWRFDFAHPGARLAVEIEGGAFSGGRHTRGSGFRADLEKYNAAVLEGWRVLRFLPEQVNNGLAIMLVNQALRNE